MGVWWMHRALPCMACTGRFHPRWNIYYFNSLVVSTIHSHKKLWVGLSKFRFFANNDNFTYSRMHELVNVQYFDPKITLSLLIHTHFLFSFSIKQLNHMSLASSSLTNISVSQIAQTSLVLGEWTHTQSTPRPICTIVCDMIHHFIFLTKTI